MRTPIGFAVEISMDIHPNGEAESFRNVSFNKSTKFYHATTFFFFFFIVQCELDKDYRARVKIRMRRLTRETGESGNVALFVSLAGRALTHDGLLGHGRLLAASVHAAFLGRAIGIRAAADS